MPYIFSSPTVAKNPKHNTRYTWMAGQIVAGNFLAIIQPYLKLKCDHAELALEYQRMQRHGIRPGNPSYYTTEELEYRDFLYNELRRLNGRRNGGKPNW